MTNFDSNTLDWIEWLFLDEITVTELGERLGHSSSTVGRFRVILKEQLKPVIRKMVDERRRELAEILIAKAGG